MVSWQLWEVKPMFCLIKAFAANIALQDVLLSELTSSMY